MVLFERGMAKAETGDANSELGHFDRLEFLGSENMDVDRPGFFLVGRSLNKRIMISGGDEDAHGAQTRELLFNEFKGIRGDALQLKKIAGNEYKINLIPIFLDRVHRSLNRLRKHAASGSDADRFADIYARSQIPIPIADINRLAVSVASHSDSLRIACDSFTSHANADTNIHIQ